MANILVVASGKGGVGKSTTAVHLGDSFTKLGFKVLLLEMDSGLRGLDIMAGITKDTVFDLGDVLTARCEPIKAIRAAAFAPNLHIIPAPYSSKFTADKADLTRLVRGLAYHYDYVLIDTPAGLGKNVDICLKVATYGIIVATPDPICARDAAALAVKFRENKTEDLGLIINKIDVKTPQKTGQMDLDEVIDTVKVRLLGALPYEEMVQRYSAQGVRLPESMTTAKAFLNIATRISGKYAELAVN